MKIDIVACTDDGFVMPTGVMIYSACMNNQDAELTFHVLIDRVSSANKEKLQEVIKPFPGMSIVFYDVEKLDKSVIPKLDKTDYVTIAAYYRLFLTDFLPSTIQKIIYLDGDIIVRHSLLPIWNTDVDGYAIAAAPTVTTDLTDCYKRLEYSQELGYFNSGVLLINLAYWRENNLTASYIDYMIKYPERCVHYDQDVLNYMLRLCKKDLPLKYNVVANFLYQEKESVGEKYVDQLDDAIHDPAILHFTVGKPWKASCRHPYRSTFFKYQAMTLWKDTPLQEDRPLSFRIKKTIGKVLRKLHIIPELPPYSKGFMPGLKPLD